jgi:hypothetical protein
LIHNRKTSIFSKKNGFSLEIFDLSATVFTAEAVTSELLKTMRIYADNSAKIICLLQEKFPVFTD